VTGIFAPSEEILNRAATLLREGRLVAFPTETVYGLGADATNDRATASIFEAKGRPTFNPLIIHLPDAASVVPFVQWNPLAQKLADLFWPGPMTLILPRAKDSRVSLLVSAGLDTIAARVPDHPIARDLLRRVALPIAAPSANASGKLSPTLAEHVLDSLGDHVDLIIDGGSTKIGVESTVIDLSGAVPTILRHGGITREMLEKAIGQVAEAAPVADPSKGLKSPGQLSSHYAPQLPVRLNADKAFDGEAFLCFGPNAPQGGAVRMNLSESGNLAEAAANLFSMLRKLDRPSLTGIAVMPIPHEGLGAAINDRLERAAAPRS
jgi:L-threonylcarbamoyladenylate synthase